MLAGVLYHKRSGSSITLRPRTRRAMLGPNNEATYQPLLSRSADRGRDAFLGDPATRIRLLHALAIRGGCCGCLHRLPGLCSAVESLALEHGSHRHAI